LKRICLGTLITLLNQSKKRKSDTMKNICQCLFLAYSCDSTFNKDFPGHLRSGHDSVPGNLIEAAWSKNQDDVIKGFQQYVCPLIDDSKKKALVRSIKNVLQDDSIITNECVVGYIPGFEKENIEKHSEFNLASLLANVFTYAIRSVDNKSCADAIKEIPSDFVALHQ